MLCVLGAANHDPAMFDDPHTLRLDRPNANRHLAFAAGIHYCLGASLARLEATVAISRLIRRFDHIELAERPDVPRPPHHPWRRSHGTLREVTR